MILIIGGAYQGKMAFAEQLLEEQKKNGKAGGVKLQSRMSRKVLIPVICLVIIAIISAVIIFIFLAYCNIF